MRGRALIVPAAVLIHLVAQSQSDTLTLHQALRLSGSTHLSIAIAGSGIARSEAKLRESRSTRFPSLFLRGHYLYAPLPGYNETVTNGGEYGAQLTAGMQLYDGGARGFAIDEASNDVDRSVVALQKARVDLAFGVRSSYFEILRLQNEIQIRTEGIKRIREYTQLLSRLMAGGIATESDLLKATIDLNNAGIALTTTLAALQNARILLNDLLGRPINTQFTAAEFTGEDSLEVRAPSLEGNLDLKLAHHEEQSASLDLSIAEAERYPSLSVGGDVGFLGITPDDARHDLGYSLFVGLEFPLFTWGGISERISQKEATKSQNHLETELTRRTVDARWQMAIADTLVARANLDSYARNTVDAQRNFIAAKARFTGGSGSNLEVLEAARLLMESQLNYNTTLAQLRTSRALFLQLGGQL